MGDHLKIPVVNINIIAVTEGWYVELCPSGYMWLTGCAPAWKYPELAFPAIQDNEPDSSSRRDSMVGNCKPSHKVV